MCLQSCNEWQQEHAVWAGAGVSSMKSMWAMEGSAGAWFWQQATAYFLPFRFVRSACLSAGTGA